MFLTLDTRSRCGTALAIVLIAALTGCGCGGDSAQAAGTPIAAVAAAAPSAADSNTKPSGDTDQTSAAPAADPQLTPLTGDDIEFYLDVMRAAAERVRHPTAQDLEALRQQQAFADNANSAAQSNATQEAAAEAAAVKAQAAIAAAMKSGDEAQIRAASAQMQAQLQSAAAAIKPVAMPDPATMNLALNLGNGQADRQIVAERHLDAQRYERVASAIEEIIVPPGTAVGDCDDCAGDLSAEQRQREKTHQAALARNRKTLEPHRAEIQSLQDVVRKGKT